MGRAAIVFHCVCKPFVRKGGSPFHAHLANVKTELPETPNFRTPVRMEVRKGPKLLEETGKEGAGKLDSSSCKHEREVHFERRREVLIESL